MPKRTRIQQDQHNQRRRLIKQEGRKAIFCMKYMESKYPKIHEEACKFYTNVNERYPGKRDLTKTYEFKKCLKDQPGENTTPMLEPQLEISLIPREAVSTTTTEEIPPVVVDFESEEIRKIIDELRQDPDLASVFDDIELPSVSEFTQEGGTPLLDDLQLDFQALGEDLPELDQEIDW